MKPKVRKNFSTTCAYLILRSLALIVTFSALLQAQTPPSSAMQPAEKFQSKESQRINQKPVWLILSALESSGDGKRDLTQSDRQELQEAIQEVNRSIRADPEDGTAYYALGRLYYIGGNYEASTENFERAIKLSKEQDDLAYYSGGISYYKLNNLQKATEYIEKAIKLDSESWLNWLRNQRRDPGPADAAESYNTGLRKFRGGDKNGGRSSIQSAKIFFCTSNKNIKQYNHNCQTIQSCMCSLKIKSGGCPQEPICNYIDQD